MKIRKSMITGILAVCIATACVVPAFAKECTYTDKYGQKIVYGTNDFSVQYNGNIVVFPDAQPYVDINSRTLVPVRFVSEEMGASVSWDGKTRTATITKGNISVAVIIGKSSIEVTQDGATTTVPMDTEAVLKNERTFIPVRYVGEALGAWVGYSDLMNTAQIYDDVLTPEEITRLHSYYDMTHSEWLAATGDKSVYTQEQWIDLMPWIQHFTGTGTYGFENANEWLLRNPNDMAAFKGAITGASWKKGVNADVELSKLVVSEAIKSVEKQFKSDGLVEATLRTDLSSVFHPRSGNIGTAYVRGVLMMIVPEHADVAAIQNKYGLSGVKAGKGYAGDVEIRVNINPLNGYVYCDNIVALK